MSESSSSEELERVRIAERLQSVGDRMVVSWMAAVAGDRDIPSADRLSMEALRDHFPVMLAELVTALREEHPSPNNGQTRATGREHGQARLRQGYRLDEVIRELARIRELIDGEIQSLGADGISENARQQAVRIVHQFFDTIVANSAQEFVESQEAEIVLRTSQLEHAYQQAQAATEQLRLLSQSRLRMLRTVVHELGNALQPVTLAARALLDEPDPAERCTIGNRLAATASRLQALLDRLREFSAILTGENRVKLERVDLDELLRALEQRYWSAARAKNLQLRCTRTGGPAEVDSDRGMLFTIGANLLSNAIAFTKSGTVHLEIVEPDIDRWILRVTDTGSGLGPDAARQIFSEFHSQAGAADSGLGLGLVIARHLAHLLGGEITFRSTVGQGSCFEANLPCRSIPGD